MGETTEHWAVLAAREAKTANQRFFQAGLPLMTTDRAAAKEASWVLTGDTSVTATASSGISVILEAVEDEGWRLENVGYVFRPTGAVSRPKVTGIGGQVENVEGQIFGIYLFRGK